MSSTLTTSAYVLFGFIAGMLFSVTTVKNTIKLVREEEKKRRAHESVLSSLAYNNGFFERQLEQSKEENRALKAHAAKLEAHAAKLEASNERLASLGIQLGELAVAEKEKFDAETEKFVAEKTALTAKRDALAAECAMLVSYIKQPVENDTPVG